MLIKKNIYILDNLSTGHQKLVNKKTEFIKGDIRNLNFIKKIIKEKKIKKLLNWKPKFNSLKKIITSAINWEKIT